MKDFFEYDCLIVGAGASGLFAASLLSTTGLKCAVVEANNKLGAKLLQTGNGKCNFTNLNLNEENYQNEDRDKAFAIIKEFDNKEVINYFKELGVLTKVRDGYVYPRSETALSVVNALRLDIESKKVKQFLNCSFKSFKKEGDYFLVNCLEKMEGNSKKQDTSKKQEASFPITIKAKKLIIATGTNASIDNKRKSNQEEFLKDMSIKYKKFLPALVALKADNKFIKLAKGVRALGKVTILVDGKEIASDTGEIQYADYGISGIPIFQVSRYATAALNDKRKVYASLDITPDFTKEELFENVSLIVKNGQTKFLRELFDGFINHKLMEFILKNINMDLDIKASNLTSKDIDKICKALKNTSLEIIDSKGENFAQVLQGGVLFSELTNDLESKKYPGLYFCGEIVDVDGMCGGYNLQWAFSSAHKLSKKIIGEYSGTGSN